MAINEFEQLLPAAPARAFDGKPVAGNRQAKRDERRLEIQVRRAAALNAADRERDDFYRKAAEHGWI